MTVPNGPAQQALLRQALAAAKLQPADIDYVEAHGTGTPLGDPIELEALSKVFAERTDSQPLMLGSVKTNLGHLEAAAGVAGFIKTVLAVQHGYIPRHLNFTELTPYATDSAACVTIASSGQGWPVVGSAAAGGGVVVRRERDECACGGGAGAGVGGGRRVAGVGVAGVHVGGVG